ncbi:MAG: hypothetical protein WDN46_13040 [Methylocella sp.]
MAKSIRFGLALSFTAAALATASVPAQAQDGGAVAAGLLGGLAIGAIAGGAIAGAAPPPPYGPYGYYAPAYAPPPPRCWWQPQQVWNGYAYVVERVRVCN